MQARGVEGYVAGEGLLDPIQDRSAATAVDSLAVDRSPVARDVTAIYRSARAEFA
jgi:hypothetical protein